MTSSFLSSSSSLSLSPSSLSPHFSSREQGPDHRWWRRTRAGAAAAGASSNPIPASVHPVPQGRILPGKRLGGTVAWQAGGGSPRGVSMYSIGTESHPRRLSFSSLNGRRRLRITDAPTHGLSTIFPIPLVAATPHRLDATPPRLLIVGASRRGGVATLLLSFLLDAVQ